MSTVNGNKPTDSQQHAVSSDIQAIKDLETSGSKASEFDPQKGSAQHQAFENAYNLWETANTPGSKFYNDAQTRGDGIQVAADIDHGASASQVLKDTDTLANDLKNRDGYNQVNPGPESDLKKFSEDVQSRSDAILNKILGA